MSPEKGNDNFYWATGRIFFWIFSMKKDKGDGSLGKNPMETKHIGPIFREIESPTGLSRSPKALSKDIECMILKEKLAI
jgi:hypothetical protein